MCSLLSEIEQAVLGYAATFEPDALSVAQADEVARRCSRTSSVLQSMMALASARAASGPDSSRRFGFRSSEQRLAHDAGISTGAARRVIQAGKRMANQPEVAKAALSGALSSEQAVLVAEGVEADPSRAGALISTASQGSLAELSEEVARIKASVRDPEQHRRAIHERRSLRQWSDRDGACHTHLLGEPLDGARLLSLLDPIRRRLAVLRRDGGQLDSLDALGYDALTGLVDLAAGREGELDLEELLELGLFPQLADAVLRRRERDGEQAGAERAERAADERAEQAGAEGAERAGGEGTERTAAERAERAGEGTGQVGNDAASAGQGRQGRGSTEVVVTEPGQGELFAEVLDSEGADQHGGQSTAQAGDTGDPCLGATKDLSAASVDLPPSRTDASSSAPLAGSEPASSPSTAAPAAPRRGARRRRRLSGSPARIMVRVDLDTLLRGVALEDELCEISGLGPVPVAVIEDLLARDSAFVVGVLTKGRQLVGVYHHGRRPNAYQSSALDFLFPTCAVAGCNARAGLQSDHRVDWSRTHYTVLDLLDRLCWFHHKLKTEKSWALVPGRAKRAFVPPEDPRHPRHRASEPAPAAAAAAAAAGAAEPGRGDGSGASDRAEGVCPAGAAP